MKILVIEDEKGLRDEILRYFIQDGDICESAVDLRSALEKIALYKYDCILLDLSLPDGDGIKLIENLRKIRKDDGLLIISARDSLDDKLIGLNMGADDYLVKPFHLSELKARVAAIVRRKSFQGNNTLDFEEIRIDFQAKQVTVLGYVVALTRKEYELLLYFIANKAKVVSKTAIAEHLWGDQIDSADSFDFIYTHVKNLRKKLLEAGSSDYIHSVYGMGYKFSVA